MVKAIDVTQCPVCGTWYKPEPMPTGQTASHCTLPAYAPHLNVMSLGQRVEAAASERRTVGGYRLTEGVEGPPLTGRFLNLKV